MQAASHLVAGLASLFRFPTAQPVLIEDAVDHPDGTGNLADAYRAWGGATSSEEHWGLC
jgi:hypothetical protein